MSLEPPDLGSIQVPPHQISCITCRQRKVKCDKQQRCSNCVKSSVECVYAVPVRPRRRIGNGRSPEDVSREELIQRVRRYEALFKKYGPQLDAIKNEDASTTKPKPELQPNTEVSLVQELLLLQLQGEDAKPRLAPQSNLFTEDLSGEILEDFYDQGSPEASTQDSPQETGNAFTISFAFDSSLHPLTDSHPSTKLIYKLWEIFLNNVNPLVKIIHVPTVQRQLLEASVDLENVSRPFEALMFAIYASAITSLKNEQCIELTGFSKLQLQKQYYKIGQLALARAGIFGTTDIVVLQAAVLFVVSLSVVPIDPGELYVLLGTILRVGERIGLHRKTYPANVSAIEAQTRRRLWWQIVVLDSRAAQRCRQDILASTEHWQSELPLNVNDSDLTQNMVVEPRGRIGSTEMIFRLMLYDIGKFIRHSVPMAPFGGSWQNLSSQPVPVVDKDKVIDELEKMIESNYLRYCDPVIPLHVFTRGVATIMVCRMRLTIRHPRRFPDRGSSMTQDEKDKLFTFCLTIIEQDNFLHSVDSVRGFLWLLDHEFQGDAFVYLISELRYRQPEPTTEKAWSEIFEAFKHHPNLANAKTPFTVALRNLTLKSWECWESRVQQQQNIQPHRPALISQFLEQRTPSSSPSAIEYSGDMETEFNAPTSYETFPAANWDFGLPSMSDPLAPMDWNYWSSLIQNAETYDIENFASQADGRSA
ncbi:hypothetical protein L207DRAFT_529269 [Hyaloscypha variabilis F]|uniref:Zn(2)-C6 fungal-type domain-containing protein n=1 Tax=Hyaloscypha variabilis (strain UAMH 11265 / GT02V1 / F) TaxID=1149755 RepID=A0A2J6RR56_HYAVF|nr:hypothetical protein L207DRAFT_529269 [Hyaloscypha variabilis F]